MRSELIAQWKRDEAAVFEGWDFSYIKDRWLEEEPGWDYKALAKGLVKKSAAVLDVATGGGEENALTLNVQRPTSNAQRSTHNLAGQ
jgi:hypothetical protein